MRLSLLNLVTLCVSLSIAGINECVQKKVEKVASEYSSGTKDTIIGCITRVIESRSVDDLDFSLVANGCLNHFPSHATSIIIRELRACYEQQVEHVRGDLKKRKAKKREKTENETPTTTTQHSTSQETTSAAKTQTTTSTPPKISSTIKSTAQITSTTTSTQAPSTSTTESTPQTPETSSETPSETASATPTPASKTFSTMKSTSSLTPSLTSSSTISPITAAAEVLSTSALVCLVTTMVPTKVCSVVTTGTANGQTTVQCASIITPVPTCAPGLICNKDTNGATICLRRDDHLTPSGLAVTIVLGVAVLGAVIAMIVACVRSSRMNKSAGAQRDSMLGGGGGGYGKLGSRSDINLQSIPPRGARM